MSSKKLTILIAAVACVCLLALFGCSVGSGAAGSSSSSQSSEDITGSYVAQKINGLSIEDYNKQIGVLAVESTTLDIKSDGTVVYTVTYVNGQPRTVEYDYTYEDGVLRVEYEPSENSSGVMEGTFDNGILSVTFSVDGKETGTIEYAKQ